MAASKEIPREALARGFYQFPGLEIQVGATQVLIPMEERYCPCGYLFKLQSGEIVAGGRRSIHPVTLHPEDPAPIWKRSKDGGRTWYDAPAWPTYIAYQFPDGEIIQLSSFWLERTARKGTYNVLLYRWTENGNRYAPQEEKAALVDVPELDDWKEPSGEVYPAAYMDHSIVGLSDGSVLASVHAKFIGDRKMWRSFVVRSTDRGRTWHYLSTVAFDLTDGDSLRVEGFAEPDLLALPSGELLCFMRTGGGYGKRHTPLYLSRSLDGGRTWGHADPIADRGVYPKSSLMANGVIAVIYGRPGDWLAFSLDEGHTWTGHFCLHLGPQPHDCGSYDWVLETAPDTLLTAYSRTDPNDCLRSEILGTFITVKRT